MPVEIVCQHCHQRSRAHRATQRFCSKQCMGLARRTIPTQQNACLSCGGVIETRKRRARIFCNNRCKAKAQTLVRPNRNWLEHQYVTLGKSAAEIAREVGRDAKSVWNWLKWEGIEIRPRGADTLRKGFGFQKGAPSHFAGRKHSNETRATLSAIAKADGRTPYGKDNPPWMRGRKGPLHPAWKGGCTPERQAFYSTDEWKKACVAVWHRADAKCERCGFDHRTIPRDLRGSFNVHHIVSFSYRPLRATVSNLVLLCGDCHRFVHSKANTSKEYIQCPPTS